MSYAWQASRASARPQTFLAGAGLTAYTDMAGETALHDRPKGNVVDAAGGYREDFAIAEIFAEAETGFAGQPVTLFAELTRNTRASDEDTAWTAGINVGKTDAPGDAWLSWAWRDTEANALVGAYTDSNMADGNTDSRGHVLAAKYVLHEHVQLAATLYLAEAGGFSGSSADVDRVILDLEFSF